MNSARTIVAENAADWAALDGLAFINRGIAVVVRALHRLLIGTSGLSGAEDSLCDAGSVGTENRRFLSAGGSCGAVSGILFTGVVVALVRSVLGAGYWGTALLRSAGAVGTAAQAVVTLTAGVALSFSGFACSVIAFHRAVLRADYFSGAVLEFLSAGTIRAV